MIEIEDFGQVKQIRLAAESEGNPLYWVSTYLVDGLLIDTGCARTSNEFLRFLKDSKVDIVVNTHSHEDHIGANHLIQENLGLPVYASASAIPRIQNPQPIAWYREKTWGSATPSNPKSLPEIIETKRFRFEVIDTPGHSPDHVSLVERTQGWVFSGDLFIGKDLTVAGPEMDVSEMLKSMRTLLELMDDESILFTSLRTVRHDGRKALQAFVDRFEKLRAQAREFTVEGQNVREIVNRIFGGETVFDAITNGEYSSANLVRLFLQD